MNNPEEIKAFAASLADVYCPAFLGCCEAQKLPHGDATPCRSDIEERLLKLVTDFETDWITDEKYQIQFDSTAAASCLAEAKIFVQFERFCYLSNGDWHSIPACHQVLAGSSTLQIGDKCSHEQRTCASSSAGAVVCGGFQSYGSCSVISYVNQGEPCSGDVQLEYPDHSFSICGPGLACQSSNDTDKVCVPVDHGGGAVGEPCGGDADCDHKLHCFKEALFDDKSECAERIPTGGSCAEYGSQCEPGAVCDVKTRICLQSTTSYPGDTCSDKVKCNCDAAGKCSNFLGSFDFDTLCR